jgi:hypothetical protein
MARQMPVQAAITISFQNQGGRAPLYAFLEQVTNQRTKTFRDFVHQAESRVMARIPVFYRSRKRSFSAYPDAVEQTWSKLPHSDVRLMLVRNLQ